MRKIFHTISGKGSGQVDPVRTLTLPNGEQIRILRRDIFERALEKANAVLREKVRGYTNPGLGLDKKHNDL